MLKRPAVAWRIIDQKEFTMDGNITMGEAPFLSHTPPSGFVADLDGIYLEKTDGNSEVILDWLCSPIAVTGLGRNMDNEDWCRCIELIDADGVVHTWHVHEKEINNSFGKVLGGLCSRGLRLAGGASARKSLGELIKRWSPARRYYTTGQLGWVDSTCKSFVLGDSRVLGEVDVAFLCSNASAKATEMRPNGTLADWRSEVGLRCSGNPILITAVSLAFAGPLVGFLGRESFGLHLRGDPGLGKTTSARTAASVWGSPAFKHSWRTTANALEGAAASRNGALLVLDELSEVTARDADKAVYMLANGEGKDRATSMGDLRSASHWSLTILSTGEISLADKMAEAGITPQKGQDVRLIDIAADTRRFGVFDELHGAVKGEDFAQPLDTASSSYYGVAGPAFIEKLIEKPDLRRMLPSLLSKLVDSWKSRLDVSNDRSAERVLGHFALVALAGQLATRYGITGWGNRDAFDAVFEIAKEWHAARERPEQSLLDATVERTHDYLRTHGDTRFQRRGHTSCSDLAGYRDEDWFYILGDTWNVIHAEHCPSQEAHRLLRAGYLVRGDGQNLKSKCPGWVEGRPRAYKVRADILDMPKSKESES